MNHKWEWSVRCWYGSGVKRPKTPFGLAIETVHVGTLSRDMEIAAGKSREDIGQIEMRDLRAGSAWTMVAP